MKGYIENSKLYKHFKSEVLLYLNEDEVIIHLDDCLEFLKVTGFKTWDNSTQEEIKLLNYLKKYLSETITDFIHEITTEDGVIIFTPGKVYNFSDSDLPIKHILPLEKLYYIQFNFLDNRPYEKDENGDNLPYDPLSNEHLGRQNWYSHLNDGMNYKGFSENECEEVVDIIKNERWNEFDLEKYFRNNKKSTLEYILKHRESFTLESSVNEFEAQYYK